VKLIVAVVQAQDADACGDALTGAGFACTLLTSEGAFLESPNATLMVGIDDSQTDQVLAVLTRHARRRVAMLDATVSSLGPLGTLMQPNVEVEVGGASVFVLPLERFEKI
jgi:uncharacterized protein YaaQ